MRSPSSAVSGGCQSLADMAAIERLTGARGLLSTLRRSGFIAPMRPDKYVRIAAAARRENMAPTYAFAAAARRCPDRPALVDERGTLTWRELDERCDALAVALQGFRLSGTLGIMCRNHRGFVEALVAANRTGMDVLLLNTSFAGPALAAGRRPRRCRHRHSRRRVHRLGRARARRQARRHTHCRGRHHRCGRLECRTPDQAECRSATQPGEEEEQNGSAHLRYHRNTEGRQAHQR